MSDKPEWRKHLRGDEPKRVAQLDEVIAAHSGEAQIAKAELRIIADRARQRLIRKGMA